MNTWFLSFFNQEIPKKAFIASLILCSLLYALVPLVFSNVSLVSFVVFLMWLPILFVTVLFYPIAYIGDLLSSGGNASIFGLLYWCILIGFLWTLFKAFLSGYTVIRVLIAHLMLAALCAGCWVYGLNFSQAVIG